MQKYQAWMVEYKIGEVDTELTKQLQPGERRIVLVAHDKSTMQANDGEKEGWVMNGEQPLKKKGAGRGLHQDDIICSTYGWLIGASVTMEYGKNYEVPARSTKDFEVINIPPLFQIIILSPMRQSRDCHSLFYQIVSSLFPKKGKFLSNRGKHIWVRSNTFNVLEVVHNSKILKEIFHDFVNSWFP